MSDAADEKAEDEKAITLIIEQENCSREAAEAIWHRFTVDTLGKAKDLPPSDDQPDDE